MILFSLCKKVLTIIKTFCRAEILIYDPFFLFCKKVLIQIKNFLRERKLLLCTYFSHAKKVLLLLNSIFPMKNICFTLKNIQKKATHSIFYNDTQFMVLFYETVFCFSCGILKNWVRTFLQISDEVK